MRTRHEIDMSEGKLLPKLLLFFLPLMLTNMLQLTFNTADLIVVGRYGGEHSLAAVGSNTALITLIVCVLGGFGTGSNVLVARYYGAKDVKSLKETISTTVIIAVLGGILVGFIGVFAAEPILRLMGTPEEVLPLTVLYLRIYFCGMPVMALYNFSSAVLRAVGDTRRPLYYLSLAGVLNVLMNLLFVIVFHMDVAGVAIATVLSQCVSCFLTVRCLIRADTIYRLDTKQMRFSKRQFTQLMRIGLPAGIQGSLFSLSNMAIQSSINSFGAVVMAGNSAGASIESFLFCSQDSITQAATASVSQNMGAGKYDRTKAAVLNCSILVIIVSMTLSCVTMLFRRQLVGIYTSDPNAITAGATRLLVTGIIYFMNGLMNMMTGAIRGHGYSVLPTAVTLIGVCAFRIIWVYTFFAWNPTLTVLYISYPVSWTITAAAQYISYFLIRKKAYIKNDEHFRSAHT
ncbi:MAG: MATE family efflux transporter [Lentisphaerae bacterium]|nr:MATE family efflux transporter [Lentisphaerota bacterium]